MLFDAADVMRSAKERAAHILRTAREEASRVREEETKRIEALRQEAAEEGYREGFARGLAEGEKKALEAVRQQLTDLRNTAESAVAELAQLRQQIVDSAEDDIIKFAVLIAERVLRGELRDPQRTWEIARSILSELEDESQVSLFVPPCVGDVEEGQAKLSQAIGGSGVRLDIQIDPALKPGDVRVETQWGWIDGRAHVRWKRLIEALQRGIEHE